MVIGKNIPLPWWEKYTLTVEESAVYFGIGEKTLRRFLNEHKDSDFIICNGTKILVKRKLFEKYIDENMNVI
ncbi:MAG: excisionase [Lachnospiraceae bacterium]|nr:excisionase [Lachnospiraceae bacterium]